MMRAYLELTKFGITTFVWFTAGAGFFLSHPLGGPLFGARFFFLMSSLYFFSAGIFSLNQYQERELDKKMPRTQKRPLPAGLISPAKSLLLSCSFIVIGLGLALFLNSTVFVLEVVTALLYNGLYTLYWKPKMAFGAIPGALPGAMPVVVGYAANNTAIWSPDCLYFFTLMFLWQMPHFWILALKYKEDYALGGLPVLPVTKGDSETIYYIGIYTFAYVALAMACPWFAPVWFGHVFLVFPLGIKLIWEFFSFLDEQNKKTWLSFFLWTTFSVLVFLVIPVFDRWGDFAFSY